MGFLLAKQFAGYEFTYWRIQNLRAIRQGDATTTVSCSLCLYRDRASADAGEAHVQVREYEYILPRDAVTGMTGDQQLAWLYRQIADTDEFRDAPDAE